MLLKAGKVSQKDADRVKQFIADNQVELSATNEPSLQAAKKAKVVGKTYEARAAACSNAVGKAVFQLMVRQRRRGRARTNGKVPVLPCKRRHTHRAANACVSAGIQKDKPVRRCGRRHLCRASPARQRCVCASAPSSEDVARPRKRRPTSASSPC